jgi:hypothetical protein
MSPDVTIISMLIFLVVGLMIGIKVGRPSPPR